MPLVFGAMAQQGHNLVLRKMLQEAQSEFLAVIFDSLVAAIARAALTQFLAVSVAVFGPRDFPRQKFIPELLARPEICQSRYRSDLSASRGPGHASQESADRRCAVRQGSERTLS